jgi:hypothetical protein
MAANYVQPPLALKTVAAATPTTIPAGAVSVALTAVQVSFQTNPGVSNIHTALGHCSKLWF